MRDENLDDADCAELGRQSIDANRFPLSPRVQRWKELLAKPDRNPPTAPELYPPPLHG